MPRTKSRVPRALLEVDYESAAQAYLRSLPLEHFMESIHQAKQREISVASFALIRTRRADFHDFSELLVQERIGKSRELCQVVPDNMVVLHQGPIDAVNSYNVELQPARPFWVLEYVSKSNKRKDYEDSFEKYEKKLKVPYYLTFYPDNQDLALYKLSRGRYRSVKPNAEGRFPIKELELEFAILDGWVRYWFRGELLPLPAELQHALDQQKQRADTEKQRADTEKRRADEAERHVAELQQELARLRAQLATPESP